MGRIGTFIIGFLLGGATVYTSLHYHVLRASDGYHLVPKLTSTFADTYVDIRSFGFADWEEHPALAAAITRDDKAYLFEGIAAEPFRNAVRGALNVLDSR